MTKTEIQALVDKLTFKIQGCISTKFVAPSIGYFNTSAIAGKAYYEENKVTFNTKLMHNENFEETVIHEMAHLATHIRYPDAKQAHGPEFKSVVTLLGGTPRTYHSYDVSKVKQKRMLTRHIATCFCPGLEHKLTAQSAAKTGWICKKCKAALTLTGEVRKVSNV